MSSDFYSKFYQLVYEHLLQVKDIDGATARMVYTIRKAETEAVYELLGGNEKTEEEHHADR